jgi:hypothetical protein
MEQTLMSDDSSARQQLINMLSIRQAHMTFEDAVADFPTEHINTRPPNVDYTFWHLVEHIRFCQWDILDYIRNPDYQHTPWPEGYWRDPAEETDADGWKATIEQFLADRQALVDILRDPATDIDAQIPHGRSGHNVFREICVVSSHNAYHIGELGILRQTMGLWSAK